MLSPSIGAQTSVPSYSLYFFSRSWIQGQLISRVVTVFAWWSTILASTRLALTSIIFRKHGNIPEGLNILALIEWLWLHWGVPRWNIVNRPLPSSKNPHFQNEARCTTFLVKMSFICMRMKNDFHIKDWAPTLVLKQRPGGTWKWLISFRSH